jgi:hypothetical protein
VPLTFDHFQQLTRREPAAHRARLFGALPGAVQAEAWRALADQVAAELAAQRREPRHSAGSRGRPPGGYAGNRPDLWPEPECSVRTASVAERRGIVATWSVRHQRLLRKAVCSAHSPTQLKRKEWIRNVENPEFRIKVKHRIPPISLVFFLPHGLASDL